MSVHVYIATSLDGYIATEDGGVGWLDDIPNPEQSDFGFAEFMAGIDALVMGRSTFDVVLDMGEWPYEKPVFVLSRSITEIPDHLLGKASLLQGTPAEIIATLEASGLSRLYIDGGKVVQQFLNAGLVDEMVIARVSVLLGKGIPLFADLEGVSKWRHRQTEVLNETLTKSWYVRG